MASYMALGPHCFQVVGLNGRDIETTTEAIWSEFGRFGAVDGAHLTGMRRATMQIRGILFPEAFGGLADYEAIRASQYAGQPLPLLRMGGTFTATILGRVTIERVSDLSEYGGLKVAFDLTLKSLVT